MCPNHIAKIINYWARNTNCLPSHHFSALLRMRGGLQNKMDLHSLNHNNIPYVNQQRQLRLAWQQRQPQRQAICYSELSLLKLGQHSLMSCGSNSFFTSWVYSNKDSYIQVQDKLSVLYFCLFGSLISYQCINLNNWWVIMVACNQISSPTSRFFFIKCYS